MIKIHNLPDFTQGMDNFIVDRWPDMSMTVQEITSAFNERFELDYSRSKISSRITHLRKKMDIPNRENPSLKCRVFQPHKVKFIEDAIIEEKMTYDSIARAFIERFGGNKKSVKAKCYLIRSEMIKAGRIDDRKYNPKEAQKNDLDKDLTRIDLALIAKWRLGHLNTFSAYEIEREFNEPYSAAMVSRRLNELKRDGYISGKKTRTSKAEKERQRAISAPKPKKSIEEIMQTVDYSDNVIYEDKRKFVPDPHYSINSSADIDGSAIICKGCYYE